MIAGEHIVPIVRVASEGSDDRVDRLHGTAFFVNGQGTFLTAGHVLRDAFADAEECGGKIVLLVRAEKRLWFYEGHEILRWEDAPNHADVAIGSTGQPSRAAFEAGHRPRGPWMWTEVWTAGFPDSATMTLRGGPEYPPRGYHGYITRGIPEGDWLGPPLAPHSELLELSFPIAPGMSGAPLFARTAGEESLGLLGVCRGSLASERYVDQWEEPDKNSTISRVVRVEHHGLAENIWPLFKWKPELLGGRPLIDAIRSTFKAPEGGAEE